MLDSYGLYKNARNAAWQVLLDNNITSLPVKVTQITKNNNISLVKNSIVNELKDNEVGISICDNGRWTIIYDDTLQSIERIRFTIAHELGHIFLGHSLKAGYHTRFKLFDPNCPTEENEANIFAIRLLAPSCILWTLNLHNADDIALKCKISLEAAQYRAERLKKLSNRNMFFISHLERKIYIQFKDYINKEKSQ